MPRAKFVPKAWLTGHSDLHRLERDMGGRRTRSDLNLHTVLLDRRGLARRD